MLKLSTWHKLGKNTNSVWIAKVMDILWYGKKDHRIKSKNWVFQNQEMWSLSYKLGYRFGNPIPPRIQIKFWFRVFQNSKMEIRICLMLKIRMILIPLEGWIQHGFKVDVETCRTHGTYLIILLLNACITQTMPKQYPF